MVKTGSRVSALALRARARRTKLTDIDAAPQAREVRRSKRINTEAILGRVSRRSTDAGPIESESSTEIGR